MLRMRSSACDTTPMHTISVPYSDLEVVHESIGESIGINNGGIICENFGMNSVMNINLKFSKNIAKIRGPNGLQLIYQQMQRSDAGR